MHILALRLIERNLILVEISFFKHTHFVEIHTSVVLGSRLCAHPLYGGNRGAAYKFLVTAIDQSYKTRGYGLVVSDMFSISLLRAKTLLFQS